MSIPYRVDIEDKVVAITGGAGVLCGCMAKGMAESGAKVAILDLNLEMAEKVASEIKSAGNTAFAVKCNVLEKLSIEEAEEAIRKELGSVDILINGAGGNHPKGTTSNEFLTQADLDNDIADAVSFYDLEQAGIQFVFNLNFIGTLLPTQVFTKNMVKKGGGCVINISSMNSFTPLTKIPAYSAAKAAITNFTQWLAVHFSKTGIRVNAIAPGFFLTAQNEKLLMNEDGNWTERAQKIIRNTPMEKFGSPEDLLGALFWLTSEKGAGFVTGTVIPVDGGFSAYSGV
ncbi:MAG: SDR family oxidoreductase [Verrucomicrobiota bacterium]|nr:SDR family oxidoreductase [Verrucomicrobiota bacterium]